MTVKIKKRAIILAALFCAFFLIVGTTIINAKELDDINDKIDGKEDQLAEGKEELESLNDRIMYLNTKMIETEESIGTLGGEILEAEKKVKEATIKLQKKQEEIDMNQDELNSRLRNMYKNSGMGFIDILLSSENVNDLFMNYDMVQLIYSKDQDLILMLEEDYALIEDEIGALEDAKKALEAKKEELATKEQQLAAAKEELAIERSKISDENLEIERQIQALEVEAKKLEAELEGESWGEYTGGELSWPTVSRWITSYYGPRPDPFGSGTYGWHSGIDIAVSTGTPIYAANSGRVYLSSWYGGYGEAVIIDHGGGMMTLYGHNSERWVSEGEWVSQGQQVAAAGSTGNSTGPHLHFEVRINGATRNPLEYL